MSFVIWSSSDARRDDVLCELYESSEPRRDDRCCDGYFVSKAVRSDELPREAEERCDDELRILRMLSSDARLSSDS